MKCPKYDQHTLQQALARFKAMLHFLESYIFLNGDYLVFFGLTAACFEANSAGFAQLTQNFGHFNAKSYNMA